MVDANKTPRHPSGSHEVAVARQVCCERLADLLERAAAGGTIRQVLGRPDLRMKRLAREARALAGRFRSWHDPPEGEPVRAQLDERTGDLAAYTALLADARAVGVSIT